MLEDCLVKNDRDWRSCQNELHQWRDCFEKAVKKEKN